MGIDFLRENSGKIVRERKRERETGGTRPTMCGGVLLFSARTSPWESKACED